MSDNEHRPTGYDALHVTLAILESKERREAFENITRDDPEWHREMLRRDLERQYPEIRRMPGACFIATVCYGSLCSPEVIILRRWRDTVLAKYTIGRLFILIYYKWGPYIADSISDHPRIIRYIRSFLNVFVRRISRSIGFKENLCEGDVK